MKFWQTNPLEYQHAEKDMEAIAVILAAGKGTRMRSEIPKPIVSLNKRPIVEYITEAFKSAGIHTIALVVGYKSELVKDVLGKGYIYVEQKEQKGTAHAIMQVRDTVSWQGKNMFIFVGDSPLITKDTICKLLKFHEKEQADATFLTADFEMKLPYARVIKDGNGNLIKCVEEKNASIEELKVTELLSSHFIFRADSLFLYLDEIKPDPDNGEYYLTDIIGVFLKNRLKVKTLKIKGYEELVGLNTPEDVVWAEKILNKRTDAKN
jgi:bifunctional N-acetylglucosamine-1-phosphate-uridyltransferase/glucosamine-1-phosphate-acetyltransferase GlmU-like protein